MKVHIGPYRNWARCQLHYDYMNKKYDYKWDDNHNRFERVLEKIEDMIQSFYNMTINRFWNGRKRKIDIRIDRYDTWGMDHTLAMIIVPMLKQLKATKQGAPYVDDADVPEHLRSTAAQELTEEQKNVGDVDNNHFKRWEYVIDEMIWTFEKLADEDWEREFYSGEVDWKLVKDEESGLSQMKTGPNHTFKVDRAGLNQTHYRIQNGLRLFGRYYQALWD